MLIVEEETYLEHYGVKGMKWGVRKKEESGSDSGGSSKKPPEKKLSKATEEYIAFLAANKSSGTKSEQTAALLDNKKKSMAKHGIDVDASSQSPEFGKKGWRPTKKQLAYAAAGAAFVGVAIFASQTETGRGLVKSALGIPKPGANVTPDQFNKAVLMSQMTSWTKPGGKGYLKPGSFLQEEMTFPAGHTFRRLSKAAESEFKGATYSVAGRDDFNRYMTNFKNELTAGTGGSGFFSVKPPTLHEVTFKAKGDVKVPSLTHALETMRETLSEQRGSPVSREEAMLKFTQMTGGPWMGDTADGFFGRLSKQGYHAIVDHMDAGVIGDTPLVIFKPDGFTSKTARALSDADFKKAAEDLLELSNRKL